MSIKFLTFLLKSIFFLLILGSYSYSSEIIKFVSLDKDKPQNVSGELFLPKDLKGKVPAMIVVHGTGGIDDRTKYFSENLPKFGIAVFEVDFKSGVFSSPSDRPPVESFLPMSFAALNILSNNPNIDPKKIGIMGFSLGGALTTISSLHENKNKWIGKDKEGFKVHVAYYPVCRYFLSKLESSSQIKSPIKVYWGTKDSYGDGEHCPKLKDRLLTISKSEVELESFEDGHHGFDGTINISFNDPAAIGGRATVMGNGAFAEKARKSSIEFITKHLK